MKMNKYLGLGLIITLTLILAINLDRLLVLIYDNNKWNYQHISLLLNYNQNHTTSQHSEYHHSQHYNNPSDATPSNNHQNIQNQHHSQPIDILTLNTEGTLCLINNTHTCTHTHFTNSKIVKITSTLNYYIADIQHHILAVKKNQIDPLKYISKPKDKHTPSKEIPNYLNIPDSDYFVLQWSKLYMAYEVSQHAINTRLFLQKTSNNYTQRWIKAQENNITLLSFPRRNQILLQTYNCETSKIVYIKRIPIQGWISEYKYFFKRNQLIINLDTSEGDILSYAFDKNLVLASQSKRRKFNTSHQFQQLSSSYYTTMSTDYLKLIQNFFMSSFSHLKKRYYGQKTSVFRPKQYSYHHLRFSHQNKLFTYHNIEEQFQIISMGKYLISSQTPLFHNIQNRSKSPLDDQMWFQQKPQPVHFLQDNVIHTEDYISIFDVYPKYEAQWVGLLSGFTHFYPNKEKPLIRVARTSDGGMVFDGLKFKYSWKDVPQNQYEVVQSFHRRPQEVTQKIVDGHMYFNTLFGTLELSDGQTKRVIFYNGYTGQKVYIYQLQGFSAQNVFLSISNNDIFISTYDVSTQKSKLTKIQFYSESGKYNFLSIKRSYTIPYKILKLQRFQNNYYITTLSNNQIYLCRSKPSELNNRRPTDGKYDSLFEQKMILKQLPLFRANSQLQVRCISFEASASVGIAKTIIPLVPLSYYVVLRSEVENVQEYRVFDVVNLIESKIRQTGFKSKIYEVLCIVVVCVVIIFWLVVRLIKERSFKKVKAVAEQKHGTKSSTKTGKHKSKKE